MITPPAKPATVGPLEYPTTHETTAMRVEGLMRDAASLVAQGNLSKAMESYNEALGIAPNYAPAYRQRALTLARLGNRVEAQLDYQRFLALDPQARGTVQDEMQLFQESGYAPVSAAYGVVAPIEVGYLPPGPEPSPRRPAEQADGYYFMARDAFLRGAYNTAYRWAQAANDVLPQARARAIMAQILFAQGAYLGAAAEARAAASMGPLVDWQVLYNTYDYQTGRFAAQFHALEDYVRQNPSSADARFLLGYEHLILGQIDQGHAQLAIAAVLQPLDVVAKALLAKDGVEIVRGERATATSLPRQDGKQTAPRPVSRPMPSAKAVSALAVAEREEVSR